MSLPLWKADLASFEERGMPEKERGYACWRRVMTSIWWRVNWTPGCAVEV